MKRLRILLLNTYDMNKVRDLYSQGLYPSHHLYGTHELAKDYNAEVIIPKHEKYRILNRIGDFFDIGFLDQQIRAIFNARNYDIIYAPYAASNTKLIILLKLLGFFRKPLLILVHHPLFGKPSRYRWKRYVVKILIRQYDTIIFCSQKMRSQLIEAYNFDQRYITNHFFSCQMGVDLLYYKQFIDDSSFVTKKFIMSAGNTSRDFNVLVQACEKIGLPAKIYCRQKSMPSVPIPSQITLYSGDFPFEQICKDYNDAQFVLIPLNKSPAGIFGMTSLLDALAMKKPVIMTKNENIDMDLEAEGVGISIADNNVASWAGAISKLWHDYTTLERMATNSFRLAQEFDINNFAKCLAKALLITHERRAGKPKLF